MPQPAHLEPSPLVPFLSRLDGEALAAVLAARPDALWRPEPRDLAELADRLDEPEGIAGALASLPLPAAQLAEALTALGGSAPLVELAALLGVGAGDPGLLAVLGVLRSRAVAWVDGDGDDDGGDDARVTAGLGLLDLFRTPLGLSAPLAHLLGQRTVAQMHAQLRALGEPLPVSKNRAAAEAALTAVLLDPQRVRALAATAPAGVQEWLGALVGAQLGPASVYRTPSDGERWSLEHGLAVPSVWGPAPVLPREVALALRAPGRTARFASSPPPVPSSPVEESAVASASAAALAELLATTTAALDDLARTPLALLRSGDGGVGARELKRLAKGVGAPEQQVRLALVLTHEIGLVDDGEGCAEVLSLSPLGRAWRADDPVERVLSLLAAWVRVVRVPTATEAGGKKLPVLAGAWRDDDPSLSVVRHGLLSVLAEQPAGTATTAEGVRARVRWAVPATRRADLAPHWTEAELLGLVAAGALSPLGRALLDDDRAAAVAAVAHVLPRTVDEVLFGADLTAVVPGDPSARVSSLLDSCADREGRGGAVVWRLSPGSVRRALDAGATGAMLLADLESVASSGGLPQPLTYLVGDVARSHGSLRVRAVTSLVRSDDEPLLAQVVADRALRSLGLALVVTTVASATADAGAVVAALRKAGYLPMPEGSDGVVSLGAPSPGAAAAEERRRERDARREQFEAVSRMADEVGITVVGRDGRTAGGGAGPVAAEPLDPGALALRLVTGLASEPAAASGPASADEVEARLGALGRHLSRPQVRLLAHAVHQGTGVEIDYETAAGTLSSRRISDLSLIGESLRCWCHSADDTRMFRVDRIRAVRP